MSRLLHAAARGARIYPNSRPTVRVNLMWVNDAVDHGMSYHIHPDDAHLAYGPISTALREMAENGKDPYTIGGLLAVAVFEYEWVYPEADEDHDDYACMFLLILAEALADEGL